MEFNIQISETENSSLKTSIQNIKSYILENEELTARIKENKAEIKNEVDAVITPTIGKEYAKILLDVLKDESLKEKTEQKLESINFLETITHVK
jgi:hypothetical protein